MGPRFSSGPIDLLGRGHSALSASAIFSVNVIRVQVLNLGDQVLQGGPAEARWPAPRCHRGKPSASGIDVI